MSSLSTLSAVLLHSSVLAAASNASITLGWDASSTTDIAGYRIYVGGSSLTYTNSVAVGDVTSGTVSNLVAGLTYYFAVTAYDVVGLESPFSGQIIYTIPVVSATVARTQLKRTGARQFLLTGTSPAGYVYSVLASKDLKTWTLIGSVTATGAGSLSYTDSNATNQSCYYRLKQTSP